MRAKGAILLVSALAVAALGWLVLHLLASNLRKEPDHEQDIAPFARWMIDHPWIMPLLALPAVITAGWLLMRHGATSRDAGAIRKSAPWIITALATLWLVLVFALVLVTFVMFLAPLYQYRELG